MFKITSRNDGTDPVVMAFNRGIVTVGELAWPVNGSEAPDRIKLYRQGPKLLDKIIEEQLWYSANLWVNENPELLEKTKSLSSLLFVSLGFKYTYLGHRSNCTCAMHPPP